MRFCEIHPFVRFSRFLQPNDTGPFLCPYDCRLFYVKKGSVSVFAGEKEHVLRETDGIVIHSGVTYRVLRTAEDAKVLAVNFDFTFRQAAHDVPIPPASPEKFVESNVLERVTFEDASAFNRAAAIFGMGRFEDLLLKAHSEFGQNLIYSNAAAGAYLSLFLAECARFLSEGASGSGSSAADKIISYLHENFSGAITNSQLAELFHYHPNYINSLIRAKTGMSLRSYLLNIRIAKAVTLLETTHFSVTQIAQEVGFCDISYFSNYFKKVTGRSPKEFRNK